MSDVTVATLCYKNPDWLDWLNAGLKTARNTARYRLHVVANDATEAVLDHPLVTLNFFNPDPSEYYLNRVYRAWNEAVLTAPTQLVVLINSDMYVSDHWLDELLEARRHDAHTLPCSLLVESGRIPSAIPEHVKDFGTDYRHFRADDFAAHAATVRQRGKTEPGRLYMPVLVEREEFLDLGGYPEGNVLKPEAAEKLRVEGRLHIQPNLDDPADRPWDTGDEVLFAKYKEAGFRHVTCLGSVVYHVQEGEMGANRSPDIEFLDPAGNRCKGRLGEMRDAT